MGAENSIFAGFSIIVGYAAHARKNAPYQRAKIGLTAVYSDIIMFGLK
jgi:hypothetical protein